MSHPLPETPYLVISPGRVNLLGEHVDYNDGIVFPAAIDRAVRLAASPWEAPVIRIHALDLQETAEFRLDQLDQKIATNGTPLPEWACYPAGVAWVLKQQGLALHGFESWFTSNVPMGSGLSSSAAVEVGFAALWQELGGWNMSRLELAQRCQEAENKYVGVNCGLMDQFACANGVDQHALYFDTRSLEFQAVPLPTGVAIVIADSTMRRSLGNSAYNERRAACEEAVQLLKPHLPDIRALRDVSVEDFNRLSYLLSENTARRARYIVEEVARVNKALTCLKSGDAVGFGQLMVETHAGLRDLYEVSIPELDILVNLAIQQPGCFGARLTGAGFGGCTVNLVAEDAAPAFIQALSSGYLAQTGRKANVYLCHASQGVHVNRSK